MSEHVTQAMRRQVSMDNFSIINPSRQNMNRSGQTTCVQNTTQCVEGTTKSELPQAVCVMLAAQMAPANTSKPAHCMHQAW
jgi:hypothetical protein